MAKASGAEQMKAAVAKKHKRKSKLIKKKSKNKNILKGKPLHPSYVKPTSDTSEVEPKVENETKVPSEDKKVIPELSTQQFSERFPVFKDEDLVQKVLGVTMTNSQKGRIRQTLKDSLKGTSDQLLPDIIHNRVQSIVKETTTLTDAELRKIRILYNMLKTTAETQASEGTVKKNKKRKTKKKKNKGSKSETEMKSETEVKSETTGKSELEVKNETTENVEMKEIVKKPAGDEKEGIPKLSTEQFSERFPVFKDKDLVQKVLGVTMTNNQKGRIRQILKDSLKGTSDQLLPDIIHNRVQSIVRETTTLTDAELRKIRILYNMLKTTVETQAGEGRVKKNKKRKNKKKKNKGNKSETEVKSETTSKSELEVKDETTENVETKEIVEKPAGVEKEVNLDKNSKQEEANCMKGPKRYVVFVGNLPLDIDKERIMQHFKDFKDYIVDVRIPEQNRGKKSGYAYVELKNELCYELALSKHHTMLDNRRINVLYTTQKDSKISKTEAKGKAAKLVALQKSGKLAGSIPLNRKRSQRRMKAKMARAKLEAEA